jgi:hypothetical protein
MLQLSDRLSPNRDKVAAKIIDGEAILINLVSGTYYSMDGVGAEIWSWIEAGHALESIAAAIESRYSPTRETAESDLLSLARQLLAEELVVPPNGAPVDEPAPILDSPAEISYQTPTLHTHRDMGDLLVLDPPMPGQDIAWKQGKEDSTA